MQALGDPCREVSKKLAVELTGCNEATSFRHVAPPDRKKTKTGSLSAASRVASITLRGAGDLVVYDFGKEVGGITTFNFGATSDSTQEISIAYVTLSFALIIITVGFGFTSLYSFGAYAI